MQKCIIGVSLLSSLLSLPAYGAPQNPEPAVSIHLAALQGNLKAVEQHIAQGTDLNKRDAFGSVPLLLAVTFGRTDVARALIEAGADLKITDKYGSTPLHLAALFGRTNMIRVLLENGADKYLRNHNGSTPFDIVAIPFEYDTGLYDQLESALGPLGLQLDYERIKTARPDISGMLRATPKELEAVDYTPEPGNDWRVSTPEEQNLTPRLVAELYHDAGQLETIYSLLVIKNDHLIAEGYFNEGSVEQLSKRASVTKSFTSAFVGLALDKGCLTSVDQKMMEFFPEIADSISDPRKSQITIRHMLQMRGGYPWEETDPTYWEALWTGKYIHFIEDIPLVCDPGTCFNYSNLTSNWLAVIVTRACGTDLKTFGQEHLFESLGMKIGHWNRDLDGYYIGSGDIEFTARDMAKFGLLYLNHGEFAGKRILPSDWVEESLQSYSDDAWLTTDRLNTVGRYFRDLGYGYQWWSATVGDRRINFAWGHGGQLIVLLDDPDMVIVTTADPFWGKQLHFQSWRYEQSIINVVGKFIQSIPNARK